MNRTACQYVIVRSTPFVELHHGQPAKVIKPFYPSRNTPSKVLDHCGTRVFRLERLRDRNHLPAKVLFAVDGPPVGAADSARIAAYDESLNMLEDRRVAVLPYDDKLAIEAFAVNG